MPELLQRIPDTCDLLSTLSSMHAHALVCRLRGNVDDIVGGTWLAFITTGSLRYAQTQVHAHPIDGGPPRHPSISKIFFQMSPSGVVNRLHRVVLKCADPLVAEDVAGHTPICNL